MTNDRRATVGADDHPALARFLGAYFHQDWMLDARDYREVVEEFVTGEPAEMVVQATEEAKVGSLEGDALQ